MAGTKITGLVALTTLAAGDLLPVVDVSDTTQSPSGSTKKITAANVAAYLASSVLPPLCQVRMSAAQSIPNNAVTVLSFNTEDLDVLAWHAAGSPTLVTPTFAGWYRVSVAAEWEIDTDYTRILLAVLKNGAATVPPQRWDINPRTTSNSQVFSGPLIQLNGTSDTISVSAYQTNTSANADTVNAGLLVELVYPT